MNEAIDEINWLSLNKWYNLFDILTNYQPTKKSVLDAYLSGVPVLVSKWESWSDFIEDKYNGYTYEFDDDNDLYNKFRISNSKWRYSYSNEKNV